MLLGDLCTFTKGTSPTQKTLPGDYPLIVTGPKPLSSADYQFEGEAVCVPMVSSTGHGHASLKRVHYASGKFAVANIVTACEVKQPSECSTRFLHIYLQHFKDQLIVPRMQGTANVSLSQRELAQVPVRLPRLAEQRRIVDLIGTVDHSIETADKHVGSLAGLLSAAQSAVPSGAEVPFGDLLDGIDSGISSKPAEGDAAGVPVGILKVSAVRPARFQAQEIKPVGVMQLPEKARVVDGDLLMTRSNTPSTVGHVCIARDVPSNSFLPDLIWRLRVDETRVTRSFLEHYLSSSPMRSAITSSATGTSQSMRKVNKKGVSILEISVPPLAEQEKYSALCDSVRTTLEAARNSASDLRYVRTELLSALLSGAHRIPVTYDELMGTGSMETVGA